MIVIDMDMPKNCSSCELSNINACPIFHRNAAESIKGRLKDCPIKCDVEDIKAEIIQMNSLDYVEPISCEEVLEIIDKHIAGKEQ